MAKIRFKRLRKPEEVQREIEEIKACEGLTASEKKEMIDSLSDSYKKQGFVVVIA